MLVSSQVANLCADFSFLHTAISKSLTSLIPNLQARITANPEIFGGKAIIRGRRLALEHILGMLAAGSTASEIIEHYPFLENEDIQARLIYARRIVGHERVEPALLHKCGKG